VVSWRAAPYGARDDAARGVGAGRRPWRERFGWNSPARRSKTRKPRRPCCGRADQPVCQSLVLGWWTAFSLTMSPSVRIHSDRAKVVCSTIRPRSAPGRTARCKLETVYLDQLMLDEISWPTLSRPGAPTITTSLVRRAARRPPGALAARLPAWRGMGDPELHPASVSTVCEPATSRFG